MVQTHRLTYLEPTDESGRALFLRRIAGPVVMLNLLRLRETADYTATPELASGTAISGELSELRHIDVP